MTIGTLSLREKILLAILALVVALFLLSRFYFTPMFTAVQTIKAENAELEQHNQEVAMMLGALSGADDNLKSEQDRAAAETYFYHDLDTVTVDTSVQGWAAKSGLALTDMNIQLQTEKQDNGVVMLPLDSASAAEDSASADTADTADTAAADNTASDTAAADTTADAANTESASTYVPVYLCSVEASGAPAAFTAFCDTVASQNHSVVVVSLGTGDANVKDGVMTTNVTLAFYSLSGSQQTD